MTSACHEMSANEPVLDLLLQDNWRELLNNENYWPMYSVFNYSEF